MGSDRFDPIQYIPAENEYAYRLAEPQPLRAPVLDEAIDFLAPPIGSFGIDAGCGIGLQAMMLAEAVGDDGKVYGLDHSSDFLKIAENLVESSGMSGRIQFSKGRVNDIRFAENTFDWAWSSDCVGYAPFDPQPALFELKRVVKPGGRIAISAWSSEMFLPGYPLLEARLKGTTPGLAPFIIGEPAGMHFLNLRGQMQSVGLTRTRAKTFARTVFAPFEERDKTAWLSLMEMRWPGAEKELEEEDRALLKELVDPGSERFILTDLLTLVSLLTRCSLEKYHRHLPGLPVTPSIHTPLRWALAGQQNRKNFYQIIVNIIDIQKTPTRRKDVGKKLFSTSKQSDP